MAANQWIQTRMEGAIQVEAVAVLAAMGLTVSDAIRMMLTKTAPARQPPQSAAAGPACQARAGLSDAALRDAGALVASSKSQRVQIKKPRWAIPCGAFFFASDRTGCRPHMGALERSIREALDRAEDGCARSHKGFSVHLGGWAGADKRWRSQRDSV